MMIFVIVPVSVTHSNIKPELEPIEVTQTKKIEPIIVLDPEEVFCLAQNIYFEARGENKEGQLAVAHVTLNRVSHNKFPNTVCGVVYQAEMSRWWKEAKGKDVPVRHRCQFSCYCDGKSDRIKDWNSFDRIVKIAENTMRGKYEDNTNVAIYYHADYVQPHWSRSMRISAVYNKHIFYSGM